MTATDERICDTCGNDHCSYGGHGLPIHGDPKDMCEHYQPMTATDELRALLDERGVEWRQSANTLGCVFTRWYSPLFGDEVCAMENGEEGLVLFDHYLTPAQAIEATLGRGECHITDNGPWGYPYVCSACGASFYPDVNNGDFNFCPNCGRKVVSE